LVADAEGLIQYASASSQRITGFDAAELVGDRITNLVHPDEAFAAEAAYRDIAARRGTGAPVTLRSRHGDGSWRVLESVATNLLEDPDVRGVVINARDVTERVEAEETL